MTPDELRAALGRLAPRVTMTQQADMLGVSLRALEYWLSGERRIPPTVERLVVALDKIRRASKRA